MPIKIKVAILLLTCDKYRKVAELTLGLLRHLWKDPPEIFVCGVSKDMPGEKVIPFTVDEKDWMGIAHQAACNLLSAGYDYCYLILDDHPPVASCNGEYLANELPVLASALKATVVSMVGWDQVRVFQGTRLGADHHHWLRNDSSYRWIFNLHPACWDIAALKEILEVVMAVERSDHSARTFEALAGSAASPIPERYRQGSYRVCGDRFAAADKWFARPLMRKGILQILHAVRFFAKFFGGSTLLHIIDTKTKLYTNYLNGPYPMFWSGLMQKGKIHDNAVRFLRLADLKFYADAAGEL